MGVGGLATVLRVSFLCLLTLAGNSLVPNGVCEIPLCSLDRLTHFEGALPDHCSAEERNYCFPILACLFPPSPHASVYLWPCAWTSRCLTSTSLEYNRQLCHQTALATAPRHCSKSSLKRWNQTLRLVGHLRGLHSSLTCTQGC